MKIAAIVARLLLGTTFLVFGLNGFLHFIKQPPPTGVALQFLGALVTSHEIAVIMLLQVVLGALLLCNRFVPLALTLLGPIIVNILLFHAFMAPEGLPIAALVALLWLITFANVRSAFAGLFHAQVRSEAKG
jgi:putative oxidoreductase